MDCDLDQWLPYELKFLEGEWTLLWVLAGEYHFKEPFFDETISRLRILQGGCRFVSCTSVETFIDLSIPQKVIPLTALIFHVSRCGSTLLSQALAVAKENIVVPEAPLFDQILRMNEADESISKDFIEQLFQKAVLWYSQDRSGNFQRYFIKLDSWHIHFYKQLRNVFPNVPFFFLTREPSAIIKSHIKRRGIHAIPGCVHPKLLGVELTAEYFQDFNYYTERVLANFYIGNTEVLNGKNPLNYFFDYGFGVAEMLTNFYKKVLNQTEVPIAVNARLGKHSKAPSEAFAGDTVVVDYQIRSIELHAYYKRLIEKITAS